MNRTNQGVGQIIVTSDINHIKWKNYIRNKLALNFDCFIEIPMDAAHYTTIDTNEVFDFIKGNFTNIEKMN